MPWRRGKGTGEVGSASVADCAPIYFPYLASEEAEAWTSQAFRTSNLECGPAFCLAKVWEEHEQRNRQQSNENKQHRRQNTAIPSVFAKRGISSRNSGQTSVHRPHLFRQRAATYVHCDMIRAGGQTRILTAQPASRRAEADVARATYELESRTEDFES